MDKLDETGVTSRQTFCRICEPMCPLIARIGPDGTVLKLTSNSDHPVSKGFACHKGLSFLQVHNDPDRLNYPIRKVGSSTDRAPSHERIGWDEAIDQIGRKLRDIRQQYGPDAIAVYMGNPVGFNSRAFMKAKYLAETIGSRYGFSANTQDLANKFSASQHIYGSHEFLVPDLDNTDFLLAFGCNPRVSKGTVFSAYDVPRKFKAIADRGGRVVFVNPRTVESSMGLEDAALLIRPDTDVYLMAALLNILHCEDAFDRTFLAKHAKNVDGLADMVLAYSPERVSRVTGIEPDAIRRLAADIMSARSAVFYMGTGLNQGRQGTLAFWLLNMLTVVTGNFGRIGGSYKPKGWSVPPQRIECSAPVETPIGTFERVFGDLPSNVMAQLMEHESRPIRALINVSGNPLLSTPGGERLSHALERLDLIVSIDIYQNDTGAISDYVLPATDWLEREDVNLISLGLQLTPFVQYSAQMTTPQHERRNDWWILETLTAAILDRPPESGEGWVIVDQLLASEGLSRAEMSIADANYALVDDYEDRLASTLENVVLTGDGKIDCCPEAFEKSIRRCEDIFAELDSGDGHGLQLISLRTLHMHNSWLANIPQMRAGQYAMNPLHIHPADARQLGLEDEQEVRVFNENGCIETHLRYNPGLKEGVVAMSHGYAHHRAPAMKLANRLAGGNPNDLLPIGEGSFEPLSGMSWMNGVYVSVEAREPANRRRTGTGTGTGDEDTPRRQACPTA